MNELILHHYPMSPFAEKVRLMLGYKQLPWRSVTIPPVMPKPDVVALTGGYRKTPILQVGADVYCDTALIARVLEAWQPQPTLYPAERAAGRAAGAVGRRHAVRRRRQLGDAAGRCGRHPG
jgi:glutathione S-transferase